MAVELGDGTDAIARAEGLAIPTGFPAVRAGHHYVDLARAYLWHGSRDDAAGFHGGGRDEAAGNSGGPEL